MNTITIDHNAIYSKIYNYGCRRCFTHIVSDGMVMLLITKRTLPTFGGADTSENTAGSVGVVPAPAVNDELKFLRGDSTWATVVQTSITTTDGTFIDLTPNSATSGSVTVTADLSATGTTSNATFLRGDNQWATPPGTYSFDINADNDSNPVSNKEITSGQTLNILGATPISTAVSAADTVTISAADFTGPTTNPSVNGVRGLVPAPTTSDGSKFLKGDGNWADPLNTTYAISGENVSGGISVVAGANVVLTDAS